jgi:hypothetical protein
MVYMNDLHHKYQDEYKFIIFTYLFVVFILIINLTIINFFMFYRKEYFVFILIYYIFI